MPVTTTIPAILEDYMHENKLNQVQLSKLMEIPNSTLSEIVNGKKNIDMSIEKSCIKLNIDGNFLLQSA